MYSVFNPSAVENVLNSPRNQTSVNTNVAINRRGIKSANVSRFCVWLGS